MFKEYREEMGIKKLFLYIDSMQLGGAQRVMNNLATYFVDQNIDVTLINDILPDPNEPEYQIDNRVKRLFLDEGNENHKNKNFYRIRKLRAIVNEEQPDVVLSFLGPPNIRMLIATLGLKIRKLVSVRNDPYKEYGKGLRKIVSRIVFQLSDGCIFQTEDAANYFPKGVRNKSRIIFNPVNEKFYSIAWTGAKKEIAIVGRLQAQKNPFLAIDAFNQLDERFSDYKLVFYGDKGLEQEIIQRAKEYNLSDRVIVFGKINDVECKLSQSSLYLLSSDYEGMPNALLEAMAVGVPVISTDCPCGGPKTAIRNDREGLLVPCGNSERMSEAISTILSDRVLQEEMSKAERARANDFRTDIIMQQWSDFIWK